MPQHQQPSMRLENIKITLAADTGKLEASSGEPRALECDPQLRGLFLSDSGAPQARLLPDGVCHDKFLWALKIHHWILGARALAAKLASVGMQKNVSVGSGNDCVCY